MMSPMSSRCSGNSFGEIRDGFYRLDFALSGQTALDILDGHVGGEIVLLIADINMPGMSGLDLLPIVKHAAPSCRCS